MIVFTNGCFDLIHPGHVDFLNRASALGSRLVVGINSDRSVRRIKGNGRPVQTEEDRRSVLLGLRAVDEVIIFDELTPEELIRKVKPDILVKGGDWKIEEIIGADLVRSRGGQVVSLPLLDGYSSTAIIERSVRPEQPKQPDGGPAFASLAEHLTVTGETIETLIPSIEECAAIIKDTVGNGRKIVICGNGGSAADAQHIAAEFVGRYESERRALPAIALTTDTSALSAISNDFGFERVFSRQVEALASEGDCLIAISTSGSSPNVVAAVMTARAKGSRVIGMTGASGKKLASLSDACVMVPSTRTARIQEMHITIAHIWCEMVDQMFEKP